VRNRKQLLPFRSPAVLVLWANAIFAAVLAAACLGLGGNLSGWFEAPRWAAWAAGGVFATAAVGLTVLAWQRRIGWLPWFAAVNAALGGLLWAMAPLAWGGFSPEGRWLASAAANACLLLAAAQWLAWRRP
jgi:energy-converting hydrogenase Eha subunit A